MFFWGGKELGNFLVEQKKLFWIKQNETDCLDSFRCVYSEYSKWLCCTHLSQYYSIKEPIISIIPFFVVIWKKPNSE